jgi:hypothetical protein
VTRLDPAPARTSPPGAIGGAASEPPRDIRDVPDWITGELRGAPDALASAHALVAALAAEDHLNRILTSLLSEPELIAAAAGASYAHDNGFDKILLASTRTGWKLRLNVWWPDRGEHTENIHDHRWDFASAVLVGRCRADYFQPADDGTVLHGYLYTRRGDSSYGHEYVGVRRVTRVLSGWMGAGDSYLLHRSLMHRIVTDRRRMAATVMLRSPERKKSAVTLMSSPVPDLPLTTKPTLTTALLAQRLEGLLAR